MKRLVIGALILALCCPVLADDWTEVDVVGFARLSGEGNIKPNASISVLNYIADKGVGLWVGQDQSAGPLVSWRVWENTWSFGMENGVHIIGLSDLLGEGSSTFNNATYGFDIRWSWLGAKNIEISTKLMWESIDGQATYWTPAIGIVIQPGKPES